MLNESKAVLDFAEEAMERFEQEKKYYDGCEFYEAQDGGLQIAINIIEKMLKERGANDRE